WHSLSWSSLASMCGWRDTRCRSASAARATYSMPARSRNRRRSAMRRTDDGVIRIVDDEPIRVIDDDDVEVPDGHTVRVRTSVMDDMMVVRRPAFDAADLADHQPGFRCDHERYLKAYRRVQNGYDDLRDRVSDAAVRDARSAWIAEMRDAWRGRQRDALSVYARRKKRPPDPDDDGDDDGDEYVAELPGTVPISPLGSEGQYNRTNSAPRRV